MNLFVASITIILTGFGGKPCQKQAAMSNKNGYGYERGVMSPEDAYVWI